MSTPPEVVPDPTDASPLDAFSGHFPLTKAGPLYKAGLAIVAFAMVLLPLVYIGLIALTIWAVGFHLKNDLWIFEGTGGHGGLYRLILYLGPAVAGGILVFFMIKPFFAAKPRIPEAITLDPAKEPLLFGFVQKICALVGAPVPCRIDVDCQVNASASLRRGLWSKDLVLTIGMPLASGLDMRQFSGVLAHEFGHFAQGAGMRLTYIIRHINFWFARVVYERDAWDLKLDQAARGADLRIGIVLHAGRGCVWLTRRILWALMHAGNAISCFMLRQMEYDADSYEAKVAGSDAFASTASRLRVLNVAIQIAYEDVRQNCFLLAHYLAKVSFKLEPKQFGLPEHAVSSDRQEIAARFGLEETSAAISDRLTRLEPFMAALRERVTLALALAQAKAGAPNSADGNQTAELIRILAALGTEMPRAHELGGKLRAFALLVQNRDNHPDPPKVGTLATEVAADLQTVTGGIQERLQHFVYPFPHARGRLTVAEYARSEKPSDNDWERAYLNAEAHVDRLFALNYRLIGRILALADAAEKTLENAPLPLVNS